MAKLKAKRIKAVEHDHDYSTIFPEDEKFSQRIPYQLKSEFIQVRKLIRAKQYDKARNELLAIDHPKAMEWLEKLEKIDPQNKLSMFEVKVNILDFLVLFVFVSGIVALTASGVLPMDSGIKCAFFFGLLFLLFLWFRSRSKRST